MIPFVRYPTTSPVAAGPKSYNNRPLPEPNVRTDVVPGGARRTLIVGVGDVGKELARMLEADSPYHVVGFVDDDYDLPEYEEWKLLGSRRDVERIITEYAIDDVFVAHAPTWQQILVEDLAAYHPEVGLHVVPSTYEAMMNLGSVESYGDIAVVRLVAGGGMLKEAIKRAFDFAIALFLLLLLGPSMLVIAAAIRLVSPGPAIFTQERVGLRGKVFTLYKFRTMVHNPN
jgi:hypothetical protein